MKGDKLYRAIGDADDKYIKSAQKAFEKGGRRPDREKTVRILKRVISVAAAVIVIGGVWVVSFITAQKRQEPVTPASTGESASTADEPSTEAETASALSPQETEQTEIDPDSECGKMIQSFDMYLKSKESGKYGDYYVSYCTKVNGAYIGFIDDGSMDYTQALENEVIDGLPFCRSDGQKLTVINGGEYRYGLAEAFNDGLLSSDKLDQFFIKYSSDQYMLYKDFESEFLRLSCEEFLDGENERNIKEKPEKNKELSLYNYIHLPYCMKLAENKYAVLYLLQHQPIEECTDEYYTVSVGGYDFTVYTGLRFNILDEYGIHSLEQAQLTDDELKALYDSYTKYEKIKTPDTTDTPFIDVEFEWLDFDFTNTDKITNAAKAKELSAVFDEYLRGEQNPGIDFCIKLGNGKYAALLNRHIAQVCIDSTENVGGYPIHYSNYRKMTVLSGDTAYFGLQNAYEHNVLTDSEAYEIFTSYRDAFPDMYKDEGFYSLLTLCFEEYLNTTAVAYRNSGNEAKITFDKFIDIDFCVALPGNKYAVLYRMANQTSDFSQKTENVSGYEFIYKNGLELKILDNNKISKLSETTLTDNELKWLYQWYEEYLSKNNNGRAPWNVPELREKFETFIKTGEAYNVDYAYKTYDGVYIGILSCGDAMAWTETVSGYTFYHGNGNKYLVIKNGTLTEGLTEAYENGVISDETVEEFYINIDKYNKDRIPSGYETGIKLMRAYWDGYGIETKTISTCELAFSILDALSLTGTGEIADKISDDMIDEYTGYLPEGVKPGTLWIDNGSSLYRLSPDLSQIVSVKTHLGEGYVLNMTDELKSLLNIAWYYYPYNTYAGSYDNASGNLDMSHTYAADSTIEIKIKNLYVEKKIDARNNSVTVEVTSSIDQTVEVYVSSYQSDDNLGSADAKTITLKANEIKEITFEFYGWYSYPYNLDIVAGNTRVTLTIIP